MKRLLNVSDDFEAVIRIFSTEEGGRHSPPFNGIRWDFAYAEDPPAKDLFMIWPDFYDKEGDSLPEDKPLPTGVELPARMFVLVDGMRKQVHRPRIHEGVRFYCHQGSKRVAEGRVTRITGLFTERLEKTSSCKTYFARSCATCMPAPSASSRRSKGLIKLNTNENPYPPSPQARSSAFTRFPAPEPPEGGTPNVLLEPFHQLA